MIKFIELQYYIPVYYWLLFVSCIFTASNYLQNNGCQKLLRQNPSTWAFLFTAILTIYVGLRPISGRYFVDMTMYAHGYRVRNVETFSGFFNFQSEWLFEFIMKSCKKFIGDIYIWFLIIDIIYFGCHLWACKRLLHENVWMAILFMFFSYQFFSFGTNGLRNGMGCAIMLVAISYFAERTHKGYFIGFFLFLLAMGCHRSVMIPMASLIVSMFFIKTIRQAFIFWVICIVFSIFFGNFFVSLFSAIGYDTRMSSYAEVSKDQFSHSGFRWDFLLYSAMPIALSWYITYKKSVDRTFTLISNTYIVANSFWVLVCRTSFSNRFAYLSWFMYALVLAYGVIRVPFVKDQDRMAGWVLIGHSAFTMFMFLVGK